jgi:hypothetical protein
MSRYCNQFFFTGRFLSTSCQLEWDSLKVVCVKITKSRNMFGTFNISKLIQTSNMICNKKMKFHHSEDTFKNHPVYFVDVFKILHSFNFIDSFLQFQFYKLR